MRKLDDLAPLTISALLAVTGCGGGKENIGTRSPEPHDAGSANEAGGRSYCLDDSECDTSFCDRTGRCEQVGTTDTWGHECISIPLSEVPADGPSAAGQARGFCGAYRCIEERCRSCLTDAECGDVEDIECRWVEELGGGNRCGRYEGFDIPTLPPLPPPE